LSGRLLQLSTVRASPRFSLSGKAHDRRAPSTPGPGSYTPSSTAGLSPRCAFAHSPRDLRRPTTAPGPGKYEVQEVRTRQSCAIGRSPRRRVSSPSASVPGPGAYRAPQTWGVEGLKPVLAQRLDNSPRVNYPGPGSYAAYPEREIRPAKNGFGTSPRDPRLRSTSPGPGAYGAAGKASGPAYTMGGGRGHARASAPGMTVARAA